MNVASQYLPFVAHHEAGHAVAAIVLNRQMFDDDRKLPAFSSVSIYPDPGDGDYRGVVEGAGFYSAQGFTSKRKPIFEDDMDQYLERDCAIREIVTCLAGPFAESAFEGYLDPFDMAMNASDENEGSSDYADAKRIYGELRFLMPRRPDWGRIPHRGNFRTPLSGQHEQLDDGAERIADIARFGLTARPYSRQFGIVHHLACA
ncbi:MAG: hypothetical protein E5W09_00215 [Mesorhizobium sp.]|uniref:hypothetical protein n=2 Tax=unclassified Mesorhizobium TaxID=325217 RepID=UPI000FE716E3|nr:hypothetical protein [Mesorhizobium sp.]RWG49812.1 MAG: hypothetical protein EOQ62_05550 [Mesorhizobium sp.]RWI67035.1 MAG: hypothetical protein EOR19_31120 [Mesorhizobium sp.]RWJ52568.1 MAG: hypothetical protein EOR31_05760 [Mesorhizobium sp.]RWK46124.1 MAG: hypothetical protein EOR47_27400 [Mesorhizobium sp.]TIV02140.1 MAG: hypothetical protein E5W09_00215 [Mesorhizobium sp.]